jgi:hypothetical protein
MAEINRYRIKFYSKEDMSVGHHLIESEKLLNNLEQKNDLSLNDLLEYYNIKLHFDNQLFLTNWTEETKSKYIDAVENVFKKLKERILLINNNTLENELTDLDYNYFADFWKLINDLSAYKNIADLTLSNLLQKNQRQIHLILLQKKLVEKYDKVIRDFLMCYENSAEIILSTMVEKDNFRSKEMISFPKSLGLHDKEKIINSYLDTEEPNLNYVRLIENSKNIDEFKLNTKTRLKAKKKSQELNDKILQSNNSSNYGISVSFRKDQTEPFKFNLNGLDFEASYSECFIDKYKDNINLFRIFKYLFFYTDNKNLITLISKQSELGVLERTSMKSKNEYETGFAFHRKEILANMQLAIYKHYLQRKGNHIESLINSYVDFLNEKILPHKLIFKLPLSEAGYLEKIRIIVPDFEFLLKQFKTLVDEKYIDLELIQIDSTPIRFSEIYSLKTKKYLYSNDNLILRLKHLFFSDQSPLFYVKPFENKYNNLYDLLTNEIVKLEYFLNYQKPIIEGLINEGYLKISDEEYVTLNKDILIYIIGEIHKNEVISYWNYPEAIRNVIDELIDEKLVLIENTLFTRQEKNYLNYNLNKKEFTNGFDLRNKYLHGTNTFSENEHKLDYYRLIKIIILTLLKIEDDISKYQM